ncbi:MAG TPA: AGE family epimerase/isomerase [Pseudonocardia sp.]|jgi:mannose/cellobiose epimerase-like protein (N-acyl-D-glucosamine 2-epimerase family)|uniref:AGE family epimerase/isomerase n=1 Tax=Pseudonocardia sp. TaxID=60912 RepID=UPI002F42B842
MSSDGAADSPIPGQADWLSAETARLLAFAEGSWDPIGGFGRQDDRGVRAPAAAAELWITGRMTHVFALGELLGHIGGSELVWHGLDALDGRLADAAHGGWYSEVDSGGPVRREKEFYQHAFGVLGAASAVVAGHARARGVLDGALEVIDRRFWSAEWNMVVEGWDESFTEAQPYRGVNAAMHGVEAFLAAYDATGDALWRDRALAMADRVVHQFAEPHGWRIPEHFDTEWQPLLDYNSDSPDDPFRPYGSTVGHGLEWSRLCLHLHAAYGDKAPEWLGTSSRALFERAVTDGWAVDGADGFVYTVDWDGAPVVRQRMHWVLAEAIGAAASLFEVTGEQGYARWYWHWWNYADRYLLDRELGSWHHELDPHNQPADTVWVGKPDSYHAVQATLLPRIPLRASVAAGVRDAVIDGALPRLG